MRADLATRDVAADLLREAIEGDGEISPLTIRGESMRPLLADGDRVFLAAGSPRFGALVVAAWSDRVICHRLIGRRPGRLLTAGDFGRTREEIEEDHVVGRVVAAERSNGALLGRCAFAAEPLLGAMLGASLELRRRRHPLRLIGWGCELARLGLVRLAARLP